MTPSEIFSYKNVELEISLCSSESHDGIALFFHISFVLKTAQKLFAVLIYYFF